MPGRPPLHRVDEPSRRRSLDVRSGVGSQLGVAQHVAWRPGEHSGDWPDPAVAAGHERVTIHFEHTMAQVAANYLQCELACRERLDERRGPIRRPEQPVVVLTDESADV